MAQEVEVAEEVEEVGAIVLSADQMLGIHRCAAASSLSPPPSRSATAQPLRTSTCICTCQAYAHAHPHAYAHAKHMHMHIHMHMNMPCAGCSPSSPCRRGGGRGPSCRSSPPHQRSVCAARRPRARRRGAAAAAAGVVPTAGRCRWRQRPSSITLREVGRCEGMHCICTACAPHVHRMCTACALHVRTCACRMWGVRSVFARVCACTTRALRVCRWGCTVRMESSVPSSRYCCGR